MAHAFTQIPIWAMTLAFSGVLILSMMLGVRLRHSVPVDPATVASGQLIISMFSLLSLLVGFTFSLALNRYDQRRDLVLEEANAIQALNRSLVHVAEPGRSQISDALVTYTRGRLVFAQANLFRQEEQRQARRREREQLNLVVADVVPLSETGVNQALTLTLSTRILDAGTKMDMMAVAHVPARVVVMLFLLSTGSALIVGISIGGKLRGVWIPALMWSLLLSLALFTIVDLDTPQWGSIRLDASPLENAVRATLRRPN